MKNAKKTLAFLMALSMLLCLAACGQPHTAEEKTEASPEVIGEETVEETVEDKIVFPLAEEVSFDICIPTSAQTDLDGLANCKLWNDLYEMTNVKINFTGLDQENYLQIVNAMFQSGEAPDALWHASTVSTDELSVMASNGLLLPLNEYLEDADLMPNFNNRIISVTPETKGIISMPDGSIYSLPRVDSVMGTYLESPIWINKTWLDQLGLDIPKTVEELENALIAFKENDMDGDGNTANEIPYIVLSSHSACHFEALEGLFGIPTKNSTFESYVYLDNGVVKFAPTTEAFKEYVKMMNRWYAEGLIWSECYTGTRPTFDSIIAGATPTVGMITAKTPPCNNYDDYVVIEPVSVEGYTARWYMHPGFYGVAGLFSVSNTCENADILMKFMDLLYDCDISIRSRYGELEDGRYEIVDGKVNVLTLDDAKTKELKETSPSLSECLGPAQIIYATTAEDYENSIMLSESQNAMMNSYEIYKNYLNNEIWPRPYFDSADAARYGELSPDIFNTLKTKMSSWITGNSDIDADWEDYLKVMDRMGIDELVDIYQTRYDQYIQATQK